MSSHPVQEELGRHPGKEASSNDAGLHSKVADGKVGYKPSIQIYLTHFRLKSR